MYKDYGDNLERFLKDVRAELKRPFLPLVVGELGGKGLQTNNQRELLFRQTQEQVMNERFDNYTTVFVPTASYVRTEQPTNKEYSLYNRNAPTMLEISQAFAVALLLMNYSKHQGGSEYEWVTTEADVTVQNYETFSELHIMVLLGIGGVGVLMFVSIVRYGGDMNRTWNAAFRRLRPSDEEELEKGIELDATPVIREKRISGWSMPDRREAIVRTI